jgi:hypothetical protein
MNDIDRILRMAILAALLIIIYILLPVSSRYEYETSQFIDGGLTVKDGIYSKRGPFEVVAIDGGSYLLRRRKW